MQIETSELIYFSPTGTTRQVLTAIAEGLSVSQIRHRDLTLPDPIEQGHASVSNPEGSVALIGTPVYAGRIPSIAADRLRTVQGAGRPAVLVVLYGNRAFEDALLELYDLAVDLDYVPVAGAAFIGEHSYSSASTPIATGRPDAEDLRAAQVFGERITEKLHPITDLTALSPTRPPRHHP